MLQNNLQKLEGRVNELKEKYQNYSIKLEGDCASKA